MPTTRNAIAEVKAELSKWAELRQQLESPEIDAQTMLDTLEGATELHEALLLLADEIAEREAHNTGLAKRISDLQDRKSRNEHAVETLRNIILQTMDRAAIPSVRGDACTLSMGKVAPAVLIEDEASLPARFFVPQDPKLDKAALKQALKDGEAVPGARLGNGGISLTIRTK
jgi:hypothetical protein